MSILVVAEHDNQTLNPVTLNVLAAAAAVGGDIHVLVAGKDCGAVADAAAAAAGVGKVLCADNDAYGHQLAENVAESITKGSRVVVYGMLQQRSWDTPDGDRRSAVEIIADDVAPSLKWASAEIRRNEFRGEGGGAQTGSSGGGGGQSRPASNEAPPAYDMDEEPF